MESLITDFLDRGYDVHVYDSTGEGLKKDDQLYSRCQVYENEGSFLSFLKYTTFEAIKRLTYQDRKKRPTMIVVLKDENLPEAIMEYMCALTPCNRVTKIGVTLLEKSSILPDHYKLLLFKE